ncbi:Monomeric sarcosine oxidase [Alphaproteobacteria bacterium SO-S41]|nr:Monomeric sarcosine oxidase [Alphaproteobacteria bacterium SO-S41]
MAAYDVAVVGLGAMGSAALFHLSRRGQRVIGLEQFALGHDKGSSHGESRVIRLAYFEHPSYVPLLRRAYENWRELERLSGETLLTVTGVLEAGRPDSELVAGSLEASRLHGLSHEVLSAAEINARFPAFDLPADYTGVWQGDGGYLKPERASAAHRALARRHGAEIRSETKVRAIEPGARSVRIVMDDEVIEAGRVVVSAGAWIGELAPVLKPHLRLTRQVLCWYRPKTPAAFALGALPVFLIDGADDMVYGFPDFAETGFKCASHRGAEILASADAAAQDAGPADEARTRRFLERYMPGGAGELRAMKTCIYTMTPDEDFIVDLAPGDPRIVLASPCSGHGFKFASLMGEVLADLALEGGTDWDISRFRLGRFG